jgi:antitoxin component YwqK of YwqJK toxin-antitoxin module
MAFGRRTRIWSLHEDDGTLQRTGPYEYGKMNGKWKEFWATGEPWREVEYIDDLEASDAAASCAQRGGRWVRDGSARRLGCEVCKPEPDDSISIVGVGFWQWWFPNGALEREGSLADGKPVGEWRSFFDNGQLKTRGSYAAGKEQGEWTGFYRDGQVRFRGRYKNGLAEGNWESFHANGKTLSRGAYNAGKRVGAWVYFDRDGKREEQQITNDAEK